MLSLVNDVTRTTCRASELKVALQCGGSDAWSGMTANPALDTACDFLATQGGTGVPVETPEIYGAEHLLTRRASDSATGERLVGMIKLGGIYTTRNHGFLDKNPSPSNKQGGLSNILAKSLGAAAKGGTSPRMRVDKYAELAHAFGLTFMGSPDVTQPLS